jgi:hypothetical protein
MTADGHRAVLDEFLLRLARSPHAADFVLRGGLLTQLWVGRSRRATRDIDLVGLFANDMGEAARRVADVLAMAPQAGVSFGLETLRGEVIWMETDFPGLRFLVAARAGADQRELQIDVGVGDPLVPPAEWIDYPTAAGPARVLAVRPELLAAWKLDGLFDHGAKRWQAKDLHDLYLITTHCALDLPALVEALPVAFEAHGDSLADVPGVLYARSWWETDNAEKKWAKFRAASSVPVPERLLDVAGAVARALRPALERLIDLPPSPWPGGAAGRGGASPAPPSSP